MDLMEGKFLNNNFRAIPDPTESPQQNELTPQPRKNRKKLYLAVVATAIIATLVIVAFAATFFIPKDSNGTIFTGLNYRIGEKMTYAHSTTMSTQIGSLPSYSVTSTSTETKEVSNFDGENYTFNCAATTTTLGKTTINNYTEKVDKISFISTLSTSFSTLFQIIAPNVTANSLMSGQYNQSEAKTGDTWKIPLNTTDAGAAITGDMSITFDSKQGLTTPAGAFKVYKVELSSANITVDLSNSTASYGLETLETFQTTVSGQMYMEQNSGLLVQSNVHTASTIKTNGQNVNLGITIQTNLQEHSVP